MTNPWKSLIPGNVLLGTTYLLLYSGVRALYRDEAVWPRQFWVYLASLSAVAIGFAAVFPSQPLRVVILTLIVTAILTEFSRYVQSRFLRLDPFVKKALCILIGINLVSFWMKAAVTCLSDGKSAFSMQYWQASDFTFFFYLILSICWFAVLMLLDSSVLLEDMRKKNHLLEVIAKTDPLTGLYNRNWMDAHVHDFLELSSRFQQPVSAILMDIDYFKEVNDQYGHAVGDQVLTMVTELVQKNVRTADKVIRWGGEEILVLMLGTDLDGAVTVAEKIRIAVRSAVHSQAGHVTASFGAAERLREETWSEWFARIDQTLYRAKARGRNQVATWEVQGAYQAVSNWA
jgi:diguanylate cyclase (GGDEF)-like protein